MTEKRAYNRLVEVQLIHARLLELAQRSQDLTEYLIPLVEKGKVDAELMQRIYDIKMMELEVHHLFTKFIEREYNGGEEIIG